MALEQNVELPWWRKPLRVIQPNMQVKDTSLIEPRRLVSQLKEMGANTIVFNTGGIYAWYDTELPYHTVNEYLPKDADLLRDLIEACHEQGLRFIARFDFSKAEDSVYLQRPEWFVRKEEHLPEIIGATRPGAWPLLMSTCINGGYRNEAVAAQVIKEVLSRYSIDGIFFNAPGYIYCRCEGCQRKYKLLYNKDWPDHPAAMEKDFASRCFDDNMKYMYKVIKEENPEIPMILYYNLHHDHLQNRVKMSDMLCTEPQDVLSLGAKHIPDFWKPALSTKVGRSAPGGSNPLGIVHSCPGMDWRHTGLPVAEYRFWLAQIPANGGQIWHSITGIPDTIIDKRILSTISELNHNAAKVEELMQEATSLAQVGLLWNASRAAESLAEALINKQIPFDVLLPELMDQWNIERFRTVLLPEGTQYTPHLIQLLQLYVQGGGQLIIEGVLPPSTADQLYEMIGIAQDNFTSEYMKASYLRFQGEGNPLQRSMEDTEIIAHQGHVSYCRPGSTKTRVLATLVPPFSPIESVGAPPERASMAAAHTNIPLVIEHDFDKGRTLYITFSLSALLHEFKLAEHEQLLANAVNYTLRDNSLISLNSYQGLQVTLFKKENYILVHFVNGAGRRPLSSQFPLYNIEVTVRPEGAMPSANVHLLISEKDLEGKVEKGSLTFTLPRLDVWECVKIPLQSFTN
ncbi:family 10 glycosylhydrolase [Paenibacillus urinalis]|uniref:family 10 glycosylhydrolase n=1 Tax=Paenibacillus urinalis TaxID=521520 RepID=UPI001960DDAC